MIFSIPLIAALIDLVFSFNISLDNPEYLYPNTIQNEFVTKCYGDGLGCFYTGPPWYHPLYRPISVPPADNFHEKYFLYTQRNPKMYYNFTKCVKSLEKSPYKRGNELKVLIHGYEVNYTEMIGVKDGFLQYKDFNVIVIDWSQDNNPPYSQAVANLRVVAAKIAQFLKFLMQKTDLSAENIHVLGHSLGGEIAGLIGQRIKGLGRITGLDPAGPYFHNRPNIVHLDASDANYVDVIHTNAGPTLYTGEGLSQPIGHADFFPNGGNHQSGCSKKSSLKLKQMGDKVFNQCSHLRSDEFFQYSINNCTYKAYACFTYQGFKEGLCDKTNRTNRMGFHSIKPSPYRLKYYLDTSSSKPFCEVNH